MPATGAHYQFGQLVLSRVEPEVATAIYYSKNMFDLGLQGPDLLFFYKPYRSNEISRLGHDIHSKSGGALFKDLMDGKSQWSSTLTAYLMGMCCHYALDRACHPLIDEIAPTNVEHQQIESAFDRLVLEKYQVTDQRHRHIPVRVDGDALCAVYPQVSRHNLATCATSIRRYNHLLEYGGLVRLGERMIGKQGAFSEMCMPATLSPDHKAYQLCSKFRDAAKEAVSLIDLLAKPQTDSAVMAQAMPYNFNGVLV